MNVFDIIIIVSIPIIIGRLIYKLVQRKRNIPHYDEQIMRKWKITRGKGLFIYTIKWSFLWIIFTILFSILWRLSTILGSSSYFPMELYFFFSGIPAGLFRWINLERRYKEWVEKRHYNGNRNRSVPLYHFKNIDD
jgi:hypothetical protein